MALPTFLILGAARAGTSALHQWLDQHPDVCVSRPAETQFFSLHADRGLEPYESFFDHYGGEAAVGESTSSYLTLPHVPARIAPVLPSVSLIAVLRDPVRQAFASWWMMRRLGVERRPFADAVMGEMMLAPLAEDESEEYWSALHGAVTARTPRDDVRYLEEGYYQAALERYLKYFDRRQLTVLFHDDLVRTPGTVAAKLAEAVRVDPARAPVAEPARMTDVATPQAATPMDPDAPPELDAGLHDALVTHFAAANAGLTDLLGDEVPWLVARERRRAW